MAQKQIKRNENNNIGPFDNFDYMRVVKNALHYWWAFAISLGIAMSIAWYINHTSPNIYRAGTIVLLKDGDNRYSITEGIGLSKEQSNIENQKFIYSSAKMIENAVRGKGFEIRYYNIGRLTQSELYGNEVAFNINYDTTHVQPVGAAFDVNQISDDLYSIHLTGKNTSGYNYVTRDFEEYYIPELDTTFQLRLNEKAECRLFSFTMTPNKHTHSFNGTTRFTFVTMNEVIGEWLNKIDISMNGKGSTITYISVTGYNTRKMVAFLKGLNNATVEYNLDKKNEAATRTLKYIHKQLQLTADSLAAASDRLKKFKIKNSYNGNTGYADDIHEKFNTYEEKLKILTIEKEELSFIQKQLNENNSVENLFPAINLTINPIISRQMEKLLELQSTINPIKDENVNNPYMKQLIAEEELSRNNLKVLIEQGLKTCEQRIKETKNNMGRLTAEVAKIPDLETQFLYIERDYKIQDAVYTFLLQKESETLIAKASNTADNEILQEPSAWAQIAPNTNKNNTTAATIGLLIPLGIIILIEFMNTKVRTLSELKRNVPDVPVLSVIPQDSKSGDIPSLDQPQAIISESFRTLRTKLKFIATDNSSKTIVFSSCNPSEGKTFCAINTAINMALAGHKCIIANYDLRRPRLEKALKIKANEGITDYLVDKVNDLNEIIIKSEVENLYILPSGTIPPNPSELIASQKNKDLIDKLKTEFDTIIIDTAPIGCVADGRVLVSYSDVFLFVVKADHTNYSHLKETIDSLEKTNNSSLNLLFNGAQHGQRHYSKYGSYGYGSYGYGTYGYSSVKN